LGVFRQSQKRNSTKYATRKQRASNSKNHSFSGCAANPPFTGTRWEAVRILGKWPEQFWFFCRGTWPRPAGAPYYEPGCRWLDGRTHNGTVGLAPHRGFPYTGTKWEVQRAFPQDPRGKDLVILKCLGHLPGVRYLRGFPLRPPNGTVRLEAEPWPWKVRILPK
jgi:hypothetical protein